MRIAVVVKYYPPLPRVSGIIGMLLVLNRQLARHADLHIVTHRPIGDKRRLVERDGYQIHRVGGSFPASAALALRKIDPDGVVFVSGIHDLRLAGPYVAIFDRLLPRRVAKVFVQATHPSRRPSPILRWVLRRWDVVFGTAAPIVDSLSTRLDRVRLLSPGVDVDTTPRRDSDGSLRIGFINHLNLVKGADVALSAIEAALEAHPTVTAVVAGTGELEAEIHERLGGNNRVELLGFIEESERIELIARCHVMLLPFRTAVSVLGVSQTVLEVMAAGNVVLGTDTAAINPSIQDGANGILRPLDEISETLVDLLSHPARIAELGAAAREDALRLWGVEDRVQDLLSAVVP